MTRLVKLTDLVSQDIKASSTVETTVKILHMITPVFQGDSSYFGSKECHAAELRKQADSIETGAAQAVVETGLCALVGKLHKGLGARCATFFLASPYIQALYLRSIARMMEEGLSYSEAVNAVGNYGEGRFGY